MKELASISCLVKGIKFYNGIDSSSSFDNVMLVREANSPYDKNSVLAILANKNREVLAHLERSVAAGVAELMDNFKCQVKVVGYVELESVFLHDSLILCCSTCISGKILSCEPGSKNYKHQSTDILLSICGELHLQPDVEMVLKRHEIVYEVYYYIILSSSIGGHRLKICDKFVYRIVHTS